MATINATTVLIGTKDFSTRKFTWETMTTSDDVGAPISFTEWADRSIHVTGTFGAGGNLAWEGSNDAGTSWYVLKDPQGTDLDIGATTIEAIMEITELARPHLTGGDGTTDLDVFVVVRRPNNMRT